jgi:hypothetical protein
MQTTGSARVVRGLACRRSLVNGNGLCPAFTACPEVEIAEQGVTIGEVANTVRLSHAEWNELVRLVKSGELNREVYRGTGP